MALRRTSRASVLAALLVAAVLASAVLASAAPGAVAVGPARAVRGVGPPRAELPPEPAPALIQGLPAQALAADVDGDGAREIIRLLAAPGPGSVVDGVGPSSGEWASIGEWLVRGTSFRLLLWRDGERDRVAVVAFNDAGPAPCCVSLIAVEMREGRIVVRPVAEGLPRVEAALAVDLDGDGTDELALVESQRLRAMRWTADAFVELGSTPFTHGSGQTPTVLGDSNGVPGDEMILIEGGGSGSSAGGYIVRVGLDGDGRLRSDAAGFPSGAASDTGALAVGDGTSRIVIVGSNRTQLADWSAGEGLRPAITADIGGRLLGVLGEGAEARLLLAAREAELRLLDRDLEIRQSVSPTDEAATAIGARLVPYMGELPGGVAGERAFIHAGRLITAGADAEDSTPRIVSSLADMVPLGLVGVDSDEFALVEGGSRRQLDPRGGHLVDPDAVRGNRVVVVSAESVLAPAPAAEAFQPFEGLVTETTPDGQISVITDQRGATVAFSAPVGSRVTFHLAAGESEAAAPREIIVPEAGELSFVVPAEALPTDDEPAGATVIVRTPAGRVHAARALMQVDLDPPPLFTSAPFLSLSSSVELTGTTEPGVTLTVEGRGVPVAADGSFRVAVSAGLAPRDVRFEAVDRAGNRTVAVPSVVAFVDYRMLPWQLIVLLAVAAAAARLYWRPPSQLSRPGGTTRRGAADDLEEQEA